MSSSNRRGGSGRGGGGAADRDARGRASALGPAASPAATASGGGAKDNNGGWGSPSRFGHFAKYTKPKIGPAFQCAVPKFVPPDGGKEGASGGVATGDAGGDESGSGSASASATSGYGTRGAASRAGGRGGRRGGGRGGGRGGKGKGGRSVGLNTACEATSRVEASIASGEASAVDIANAAAEDMKGSYGSRAIPRGGLCVHRPLSCRVAKGDTSCAHESASAAGLQPNEDSATSIEQRKPPQPLDEHEDYLTFTRNVFLQTPRPHSEPSIDEIWDEETAKKFYVAPSEKGGRRGRANKRKASAAAAALEMEDETSSAQAGDGGDDQKPEGKAAPMDAEQSSKPEHDEEASEVFPLCGQEADEQALSYLQANYHGDLQKAKLSIMVSSDRGHGVQRRRQLKKRRKDAMQACPDATTFTSESWRWRVHYSRPTMLGDYRASRDPTYNYFDPSPIDRDSLVDSSLPWRLKRFGLEGDEPLPDLPSPSRPRSFSITWSVEEIEKAKIIWKSILDYTNDILAKMEEARDNVSKCPLSDLLELVGKAHALPTPEEAFGRRDPSARQMSVNMNSVIDAIENGRDCVARILKSLKDDGEGIELETLRKSILEIEQTCPVRLPELDTVKRQVEEATLWEEKLESNVDHGTADSDASEGEDVITEKKLTLEKVERLVSKGRNLTIRPRSLVRLQDRVERAHVLRRRISVWNEARNQENPQNMKFISTLIKEANKVDLAFPELFTLTGVHKKAEEWMDRASIAVRTTISFEELESLVSIGESLPLNVSDVLEKLQNRLKQANEWIRRLEEIVPKSEDYLSWLRRFRHALEDNEKNAHLLSLLSEGSRIPVTMECSKLLQIEIDARHWTAKAKPWIPENLGAPGETSAPQKRGKIDDVEEYLDRAASLRDRLWFGEDEKTEWVLDGESELTQMVAMAKSWFEKYDDILNYDSRRNGKLRLQMSKLHAIVDEVNRIPLNLGNPSIKMNRMFTQADEWMNKYHPLIKRCGIESTYTPADAGSDPDQPTGPLKIDDLSTAVAEADSDLSVDLEVVVKMRDIVEKAQEWIDQVNAVAPKKDPRKKGRQERQKHSMSEISDLIDESASIIVDISDELERLKLEQSTTISWRLQAQQTLREIVSAFESFRKERVDACSVAAKKAASQTPAAPEPAPVMNQVAPGGSMTTRNINSRRRVSSNVSASGSETPAYAESGGKHLFPRISNFLKTVKTMNVLTPEGNVADELSEVSSWFTKSFKLMSSPSDAYERRNFSKLDKAIESGQKLVNLEGFMVEEVIPEDVKLVDDLRQSWAAAVKDDIARLLELQSKRDRFVEWCEKADGIISSTDKKVPIETLRELKDQSSSFPSSSEIVIRVRKRAKEAIDWYDNITDILKNGHKIPLDEAKEMTDTGEKLNISCPEYKTLRTALRATRGWLMRVKKCGAANGHAQVSVTVVTELINEHNSFLVTATEALSELKQVMCGYCVCRQPYEGFMIGCDGCEEWYHGPCVGISQEQSQKLDKYVCVRCSTLRVYKDNATTVAGILRKWTSEKGLSKARSADSQRYGRKVRSAERDIVKAKADLEKNERELNSLLGIAPNVPPPPPQMNGTAVAPDVLSQAQDTNPSAAAQNGKLDKSEKALRDKIGKAHTTIGNCEKRMEGYKTELVERKSLEAREDALALSLKKWCAMVKQEVFSPLTREKAELSRPRSDGSTSAPMDKARKYAETLGIASLPDIDAVLNSFKIFSWCLHSLGVLMRKPRVDEVRSLLSHSDSGYFKLPEAKCVRMLRSMSSRAQIWQSKTKKALMPVPGETKPYDLAVLKELLLAARQIPLIMPEEARLWSTVEDRGTRHCICGGPGDGSFMLGCDSCDRWFHGSCMKIDKATGDALSKWICPICSKGAPAQAASTTVAPEDQALPAQEVIINPPAVQHPHLDISPHAPNPMSLWPPFGLREEAIEALGKVGESDNEDFEAPSKPAARAKPEAKIETKPQPQSRPPPQDATVVRSTPQSAPQPAFCQPVASAASVAAPRAPQPTYCQPVASSAGPSAPSSAAQATFCQPVTSTANTAPSVSTTYRPQATASQVTQRPTPATITASLAPTVSVTSVAYLRKAAQAKAPPRPKPGLLKALTSHLTPPKTNHQTFATSQRPLPQAPPRTNAYATSATSHYTLSASSNHSQPAPTLNTAGLNGADLSAAVANMDAYVLGTGNNSTNLQNASNPNPSYPRAPAMQMNVPNTTARMSAANGQSYNPGAYRQATPKAP